MDDLKPPALAAEAEPVRAKAPPIELKRPSIYESLRAHLAEANHEKATSNHQRVHEHAALRGFVQVQERDAISGVVTMKPAWQMRALIAWWADHGMHHDARISPQHFDEALHEALHGRI